ncbi:MAG: protein-arginine deiminase family protein [Tychonema bourrellyi B0820]|uniref:Protein-arginine deiminase n=1 Tax=Tychonema bourrellyi FEM_GT703 TaxID=2040638 RepID=A0A2G4F1H4_9CYAN|nr:protein-arginine deiminase family protein [Tychonema bourrellyi]MDQ2100493.1 protein-arginine deiminase family protein [Tychonema bourrellyi B0820]PHX55621.1 protein-arginine deiminase [Tychonema bourrellyi FEM_GT703]
MRLVKYIAIAIVNTFGVIIGIIWVAVPQTLAQPSLNYQLAISQRQPEGESPRSLPELYKLRDRLKLELDQIAKNPDRTSFFSEPWKPQTQRQKSENLTQQLENLKSRIQIEETAKNTWNYSAKIAREAVVIGRTAKSSPASWEQSQRLWQSAINTLRQIPHGSFLADGAIDKTIEYQGNLTVATYELQVARNVQKALAEEQQKKELERQAFEKKEQARKELERQEFEKKELVRKELEKKEFEKNEIVRKEREKQELVRQEIARKEREKQELARQELERQALELNQPTIKPNPIPFLPATPSSNFFFAGDTNRDGEINQQDEVGKEKWSLSSGALVLFNDKSSAPKIPVWQETKVSAPRRPAMLSQVHLKLSDNFKNSQIFITADSLASPHISVFQKTADGWQAVDISGTKQLVFSTDIVLGIEAKQFADRNWNGLINLKATAINNGIEIASNTIQLGVTPWIMPSNSAPVTEVQVSDRGSANSEFISQLKQAVEPTGALVKVIQGDRAWMQDTQKNGYVQFTEKLKLRNLNVAVKSNSNSTENNQAKSNSDRDLSVFKIGKPRNEESVNQWADGYGNLQVTPPIPAYPMGRVYYGNPGNASFNPEVLDFVKAQRIQGQPVDIDTSWLLTRQVDEIINFIPSTTPGKYIMAIASPEAGVKLLEELAEKGYGDVTINRGLSNEITVSAALNNQALIQHNLNLQKQKLNPIIEKLKREFSLTDDQIIQVPAMFGYSGYAWWPNMVNSVPVNGSLLVSNPRGALIDGKDYTQKKLRQLLLPFGVNISFLDDRYYQELRGNVQSATNTVRKGEERPFWQSLPNN